MTEQECYELLGFDADGEIATTMTIERLTDAITQRIFFDLVDSADDITDFTPVLLGIACMILKKENKLLFLVTDEEGSINVSANANFLFRVLSSEGMLHEVVDDAVVTELERLRAEFVEAKMVENDNRDRAEYDRLKAKFEKN